MTWHENIFNFGKVQCLSLLPTYTHHSHGVLSWRISRFLKCTSQGDFPPLRPRTSSSCSCSCSSQALRGIETKGILCMVLHGFTQPVIDRSINTNFILIFELIPHVVHTKISFPLPWPRLGLHFTRTCHSL